MNLNRELTAVVAVLVGLAPGAVGQPPAQFQVWGSQGSALANAPMDWTEVPPTAEGLLKLTPTEEETRRGFIVFALDPTAPAPLGTPPVAALRTESVRCLAARGQYEPLTFALWPLVDLAHVTVQARPATKRDRRGDPRGPGGRSGGALSAGNRQCQGSHVALAALSARATRRLPPPCRRGRPSVVDREGARRRSAGPVPRAPPG